MCDYINKLFIYFVLYRIYLVMHVIYQYVYACIHIWMTEHIFKGCKCYSELFSECLFIQLLLFGNSLNQKCF